MIVILAFFAPAKRPATQPASDGASLKKALEDGERAQREAEKTLRETDHDWDVKMFDEMKQNLSDLLKKR